MGRRWSCAVALLAGLVSAVARAEVGDVGPWTTTTSLPYRVNSHAAAAIDGRIYVSGGFRIPDTGPSGVTASVIVAQPASDGSISSWVPAASLPEARYSHAMTADPSSRTLYVAGGVTNSEPASASVFVGRVGVNGTVSQWTAGPSMPEGRYGHSLVAYNGNLYALAGITGTGAVRSTGYRAPIRSDGSLGAWSEMHFPAGPNRRFACSFAYDGRLYVSGGYVNYDSLYRTVTVSPIATSGTIWTGLAALGDVEPYVATSDLPSPRAHQSISIANGFAYVCGGDGPFYNVLETAVHVAPVRSGGNLGSWRQTQSLPTGRTLHASAVARGHLFVLGGEIPGVSGGNEVTATVVRAALPADTVPPRTVATPLPGGNTTASFTVTLSSTDIGGSGVLRTYYSTTGSTATTSSSVYVGPFAVTAPVTVSFFSVDALGNTESPTTLRYTAPAIRYATRFDYPVGKPDHAGWRVDQRFLDCDEYPDGKPLLKCRHLGEDWNSGSGADDVGLDVCAIADGDVIAVGNTVDRGGVRVPSPMGYVVMVRHILPPGSQYEYVISLYGHLGSDSLASVGPIRRGERVGVVGSVAENGSTSTNTYLPHLHLEIRTPEAAVSRDLFDPIDAGNPETGTGDGYYGSTSGTYTSALGWVSPSAWIDSRRTDATWTARVARPRAVGGEPASRVTLSSDGDLVGVRYGDSFQVHDGGSVPVVEDATGAGTLGTGAGFSTALASGGTVQAFSTDAAGLVTGSGDLKRGLVLIDVASGAQTVLSRSAGGEAASAGGAFDASMSRRGSLVAFSSAAPDIVAPDTNDAADVFVTDVTYGDVYRVSVAADGSEANGPSHSPAISDDGLWVAFVSEATNLVAGDTNGRADVFVFSMADGSVTRASAGASGGDSNGASRAPSLSDDGRFVVFESDASNLVDGDTNQKPDVFRFDRTTGATVRINARPDGSQTAAPCRAPRIAPRSGTVAFLSEDPELGGGSAEDPAVIVVRPEIVLPFRVTSSKVVLGRRAASRGTLAVAGTIAPADSCPPFDPTSTTIEVDLGGGVTVSAGPESDRIWHRLRSGKWRLKARAVPGVRGPITATWDDIARTFTVSANRLPSDALRLHGATGWRLGVTVGGCEFATALDFETRRGAWQFPARARNVKSASAPRSGRR